MEDGSISGGNAGSASVDSGGASPASHDQSATTSASSAEQSTPQTGSTDSTEREGFIPRQRFDEVNSRMSAAERALQDYQQRVGWAEQVNREHIEQMQRMGRMYQEDRGGFTRQYFAEALNDPELAPIIRSEAARMLGSARSQQPESKPLQDVPIVNERGETVGSLKEFAKALLDQEIAPLKQDFETRQAQAQKAEKKAQNEALADQHIEYVTQLPWFDEYKADIRDTFVANKSITLFDAYNHVLKTKIYPAIGQKSEAKVLSDLQLKANAQTVNPGMPTGTGKPKFKDFGEALAYYAEHRDEAEAMAKR